MTAHPHREPFGVLLMAYGSPNSLEEIAPYYTDVRGGRPPTPELLAQLTARYQAVGGRTPLLAISQAQARGLQARLDRETPGRYRVYLGMKHWHPLLAEPVRQMARDQIHEAIAIALAPHYSRMSIGGYIAKVEAAQEQLASEAEAAGAPPAPQPTQFTFVRSWHDQPIFWEALAERVRAALAAKFSAEERASVFVLFTAHSLPERIREWDDPYPHELRATSEGIASLLALPANRWDFAFQSAGRTPEPWLGPDILTRVRALAAAGERMVLVCPVGFIADHLEILYDIDIECRNLARELGSHVERIEMLNSDPALIEALATVVRQHTPLRGR
ncbi:MAG TPA: ferrochelatase [Ktedonobacterales bacterium]